MNLDTIMQLAIPESRAPQRAVPINQTFGGGGCDVTKAGVQRIGVPFGERAADRVIRIHELLHARYTPPFPMRSKTPDIALNAAEDQLVHMRFWQRGAFGAQADRDALAVALRDARTVQQFAPTVHECNIDLLVWLRCHAIYMRFSNSHGRGIHGAVARLGRVLQASPHAARLEALSYNGKAKLGRSWRDKVETVRNRLRRAFVHAMFRDDESPLAKPGREKGQGDSPSRNRQMAIVEPPRPLSCRANMKRQYVVARSGALIRSGRIVHALTTGNLAGAFLRHKRSAGGTIVIDASGSMGMNDVKLQELCSRLPAALVAYYSDYAVTGDLLGTLVVYARNGKRIREIVARGGGNGCDLQAVQWLCKQAGPRVFVSDGGFCGGNFDDAKEAEALLSRKVRQRKITWVTQTDVDKIVAAISLAL